MFFWVVHVASACIHLFTLNGLRNGERVAIWTRQQNIFQFSSEREHKIVAELWFCEFEAIFLNCHCSRPARVLLLSSIRKCVFSVKTWAATFIRDPLGYQLVFKINELVLLYSCFFLPFASLEALSYAENGAKIHVEPRLLVRLKVSIILTLCASEDKMGHDNVNSHSCYEEVVPLG